MQATTELVLNARCLGRALRLGQWHKLPFFLRGMARATAASASLKPTVGDAARARGGNPRFRARGPAHVPGPAVPNAP
jgi:hypothetical protein